MPQFNLNDYEQVKDRVKAFHAKYEDGRIITTLLSDPIDIKVATFKAEVYLGDILKATGHAFEVPGANANKFSHLENSETSAVGRALANMGLHGDKRPSREEMDKVNRGEQSHPPQPPPKPPALTPAQQARQAIDACKTLADLQAKKLMWAMDKNKLQFIPMIQATIDGYEENPNA